MRKFLANALVLGFGVALLAPVGDAAAQGRDWDRDRAGHDRDRDDRDRDDDRRGRDRGAKHWGGRDHDRDSYSYRDNDRRHWDNDRRWDDDRRWDHRWGDRRWDNGRRWGYHPRFRAPVRYVRPRGYYSYRWNVGHRLPPAYYGRNYYIDYRSYDLAPPPYGHRWVRVDDDVFLVAIATGLISHAVHDLFYH